jgi:ribosomal peptide maturation radical SAM protein 1
MAIKPLNLEIERDGGDAIIIIPPFGSLVMPHIGVHILQSCARKAGFHVDVLYANFIFAAEIGELNYEILCRTPVQDFIGERIFSSVAYGLPPLGSDGFSDHIEDSRFYKEYKDLSPETEPPDFMALVKKANEWVDNVCEALSQYHLKVVGCTTTFEQTAASVALLNKIKSIHPETVTIIGGANCLGDMGEGISSLGASIDYIFSGESEISFIEFLKDIRKGTPPANRIIKGRPCMNLEDIPTPDYTEFFRQMKSWLPDSSLGKSNYIWLPYESSRGCWWGQKRQCTFCGLNGEMIQFRQKSANHVLGELKNLLKNHPTKNICMTDNIMPYEYFKTLIPRLNNEVPDVNIFYELKANLSLKDLIALKKAGIKRIQPGIESLSTQCLRLMNKGVSARQNLNLLRYARSVGLSVAWNILFALPGDKLEGYQRMLDMLPLIRHLPPPIGLAHLSIERFSQYFAHPEKYGIKKVSYLDSYRAVLPHHADVMKIAYHFIADYNSESKQNMELMRNFKKEIDTWCKSWASNDEIPTLALTDIGKDRYMLLDTRGLPETQEIQILSYDKASIALTGRNSEFNDGIEWALKNKLIIKLDSMHVPLVTAQPELLLKFETESKN